jgi:GAF domain-containing protein/anti-sigma regulatory factor (Ser/Thr protein kinase)
VQARPELESALAAGSVGVFELHTDSEHLRWTGEFAALHGLDPESREGTLDQVEEAIHSDDCESVRLALQEAAGGGGVDVEYRLSGREVRWLELRAQLISEAGPPALVAGTCVDVTERRRHEDAQRFLVEAGALLGSSLDYEKTLAKIAQLAVPRLADWCAIELADADGSIRNLVTAHTHPERVAQASELRQRYPPRPDDAVGVAAVLRTGKPELYPDVPDSVLEAAAHDARNLELLRELGLRSGVIVPLLARGRAFGAITLASAESDRRYGERDLALLEELARRASLAIENARLYAREREARERAERLQSFSAALAEAAGASDVVDVVVRKGLEVLGAHAAAVFLLTEDGSAFELRGAVGYAEELRELWKRFPADTPGPAAEAIGTRALVVVESPEELVARWPQLAEARERTGDAAAMCAPLEIEGRIEGVIYMAFRAPRSFGADDRWTMATISAECSHVLERVRLFEAQREARAEALRLARRLRALQSVIDATLAPSSLDDLLHELLRRLREALGTDTASILLFDEERNELVSRATVGLEVEIDEGVRVPLGRGFAGQVAARREPWVVENASTVEIFSPFLREQGVVSMAGVPMLADERIVGVLDVGSLERRQFSDEDVLLLRLVASRAALAVEQAVLHERQRTVAVTLQRSLLPERLPALPSFAVGARYVPGGAGLEVGGDWYDAIGFDDGRLGIVVGDVVGRGVVAAAAMGQLRNAVRAYALEGLGPATILERLNQLSLELGPHDLFATVTLMVADPRRSELRLASAGHPPPLLVSPGEAARFVEGGRSLALGASRNAAYEETAVRFGPGDLVLAYTDGLVERRNVRIDESLDRLRLAVDQAPEDLEQLLDRLLAEFDPTDHGDDVAVMAVRMLGPPSQPLRLRHAAVPSSLAQMRMEVRQWLAEVGATQQEIYEIAVACNEACTNAIEHPLRPPGSADFEVEGACTAGTVRLVVRDFGRWREPRANGDRGRGLDFIRALMDSVDVRSSEEGTEIHMQRLLGSSN